MGAVQCSKRIGSGGMSCWILRCTEVAQAWQMLSMPRIHCWTLRKITWGTKEPSSTPTTIASTIHTGSSLSSQDRPDSTAVLLPAPAATLPPWLPPVGAVKGLCSGALQHPACMHDTPTGAWGWSTGDGALTRRVPHALPTSHGSTVLSQGRRQ